MIDKPMLRVVAAIAPIAEYIEKSTIVPDGVSEEGEAMIDLALHIPRYIQEHPQELSRILIEIFDASMDVADDLGLS